MSNDLPRKRLKRSAKSCYPCRSRKVKCSFTTKAPERPSEACAECVKTCSDCNSYAERRTTNGHNAPAQPHAIQSDYKEDHGSRLDRIEGLLKKLVEAQDGVQPPVTQVGTQLPIGNLWDDPLLLDMGDFGSSSASTAELDFGPELSSMPNSVVSAPTDERQSLMTLLPSPQNAVTIVMNTLAWLWGAETPSGSVLRPDDTIQILDLETVSRGSSVQVAKTLLLFALYMQQLPSDFDESQVGFENIDKTVDQIVNRVKAYLLTHEDEASTLDGLESLLLLSTIYLNTGDIKKTWASFRRTLDMARLCGVHHSFAVTQRDSKAGEDALRRRVWLSAVCGECYCSLLLGQESTSGTQPFGLGHGAWNDPVAEDEANIQRRLCMVIAKIAERNAVDRIYDQRLASEHLGRLDEIYKSLPLNWWDTPLFEPGRSLDSAREPNRLVCQLWYFLARTFAALPIAFGKHRQAARQECIDSCRSALQRHTRVRHVRDQLSRCRGGEQAAFLSAVVLLLAIHETRLSYSVDLGEESQSTSSLKFDLDRDLIQQTIMSFDERRSRGGREDAAAQCSQILSRLSYYVFEQEAPVTSFPVLPVDQGGARKLEMESVIETAIRPSLDSKGYAAGLLNLALSAESERQNFDILSRLRPEDLT